MKSVSVTLPAKSSGPVKYLRADELATYLSIGRSTVWLWCKTKPTFPTPIRLSRRVTVFDIKEVRNFVGDDMADVTAQAKSDS